ncbi:putative pectinesterase inhibitor domain-containing protein [Helianthus anomalus]
MTTLTCFFVLLSLYVTAYARIHPLMHQTQTNPKTEPVSADVIEKACAQSAAKDLCVSSLKTASTGGVNDLKQAAWVAIQAASGEATATSELIKAARKREENKEVVEDGIEEETLADCNMSYISLVETLAKAAKSLSAGPGTDALGDIKAAVTTAETCDKSIAGGRKSPMVEEVAKKNEIVRKLCSNALSVYNVYAAGP